MTSRDRDKIAGKILNDIVNSLDELDERLVITWEEMDDEDQDDVKNEWLKIIKRHIPVESHKPFENKNQVGTKK